MIYLYVKTHNVTRLKYFGKTTRHDPISYPGSGKYWKRHLTKHGCNFTTDIIGEFDDPAACQEIALKFSIDNDIVNSDDWANLREENGLDGAPVGNYVSDATKGKISASLIGKKTPKSKYVIKEDISIRKARQKEIMSNTIWINDGVIVKRIKAHLPIPEGWVRGRPYSNVGHTKLKGGNKNGNSTRGKIIYNNGSCHRYFIENQQPEGWVRGKMEGCQGGTGALKKGKTYEQKA